MDYGINQDVFFGTVTNTSMGVMNAFKLTPAPEAVMAATTKSMAEGLGLETSTSSYMYFEDANNDGVVDFIPLVKLTSSGELALDNNQIQIRNYCLGWMERVVTGQLPASHFMKTQYTINRWTFRYLNSPETVTSMLTQNCMNGQTAHPVRWPIRVCHGNTLHGRFGPNLMMQPKILLQYGQIWYSPIMMTTGGNYFIKTGSIQWETIFPIRQAH